MDSDPGNDKQNYVAWFSVSHDNGKITQKEMPKLFFQYYCYHYGMVKCCRKMDFEEMDPECSIGKSYGFWVLWGMFKEYIKQNIIMAVLRKADSDLVVICICRVIKNQ